MTMNRSRDYPPVFLGGAEVTAAATISGQQITRVVFNKGLQSHSVVEFPILKCFFRITQMFGIVDHDSPLLFSSAIKVSEFLFLDPQKNISERKVFHGLSFLEAESRPSAAAELATTLDSAVTAIRIDHARPFSSWSSLLSKFQRSFSLILRGLLLQRVCATALNAASNDG
jgi:hypothetical protein